ncbi:MAG: hypothetical protein GYB68_02970 [Chloroflexi bacterium]|nr:hypothetical protein [Chloroflexota bacterium]
MRYVVPAAIAIGVGLITLLSYLFVPLAPARLILTDWAVVLAGLAVLVGLLNVILVNTRRIQEQADGSVYNIVTAGMAILTFLWGAGEVFGGGPEQLYAETSVTNLLFRGVIVASQAAIASLIMVILVLGAMRMTRRERSPWTILFVAVVLITLVGWLPFAGLELLNGVREWIVAVPAAAGARGILLGVALGTITVGLRVIIGSERPYKD